jgi:hypothetical protein
MRLQARRSTQLIKISVEAGRGAARYRIAVQAESIERALEIVERQNPGCEAKVAFPIDPEVFYFCDTVATTVLGDQEQEVA